LTWAFIWMMFILKIPIAGLFWIVWRAIKSVPETAEGEAPGGGGSDRHPRRHPPRPPRRGDHGEPLPTPPARVRAVSGSVAFRA
jgi:hypothetical protein